MDFLTTEFGGPDLAILDFKTVHFETSPGKSKAEGSVLDRPVVSSVRIKGQYLDAHREACQLIVEGRRLLEVELTIGYRIEGRVVSADCRFSIREDHVSVATGVGLEQNKIPSGLHSLLVGKIRARVPRTIDASVLNPLLKRIQERARQSAPAEKADMISRRSDTDPTKAADAA